MTGIRGRWAEVISPLFPNDVHGFVRRSEVKLSRVRITLDRIAIHGGGGGIGSAVSTGCLHAGETDLRWLLRRVPLGTQVVIHP